MYNIRRLLCFLITLAAVALASPGFAATKQFNVSLSSIASDGSMTATFNNLSTGNSVIKSESLTVPSGFTITSASAVAPFTGSISPTCTVGAPCTTIQVNFQSGIPTNSAAALQLTVTVPATTACSQSTWTTSAFTGNNLGGTQFNYIGALPTTTNQSGCSLAFVKQPTNASINTATPPPHVATITSVAEDPTGAPVQVAVVNGSNSVQTWFTGGVTLTNAGTGTGTGTLTGGGPINAVNGVASFASLTLDAPGLYALTASSSGLTSVNSNSFTIFGGILNCGDSLMSSFTNPANVAPDQPGYSTGNRGTFNKDGSTCIKVPYTFTNTILANDQVHLSWDTSVQPSPTFMYSMNWRPRNVEVVNPLAGWTLTPRPGVAWIVDGSGNPIFVPGLACVSGKLPAPYGNLGSAIDTNATQITITGVAANPASPYAVPAPGAPAVPDVPFPIVLANTGGGTERMTATQLVSQSGTGPFTLTYNVTRHTVTEGFWTPASHAANTIVMSTPLPIIPNDTTSFPAPYTVQTQAQMCIAEHGFDAFRIGPDGTTQIMYFSTVIDIGDGYVQGNF